MEPVVRDDVQLQILEHLRALRAEVRTINERLDRIEALQPPRHDLGS